MQRERRGGDRRLTWRWLCCQAHVWNQRVGRELRAGRRMKHYLWKWCSLRLRLRLGSNSLQLRRKGDGRDRHPVERLGDRCIGFLGDGLALWFDQAKQNEGESRGGRTPHVPSSEVAQLLSSGLCLQLTNHRELSLQF